MYEVADRRAEGPLEPDYEIGVVCSLCAEMHIARYTLGQIPFREEACPHCGCTGYLRSQGSDMARKMRQANAQELCERESRSVRVPVRYEGGA